MNTFLNLLHMKTIQIISLLLGLTFAGNLNANENGAPQEPVTATHKQPHWTSLSSWQFLIKAERLQLNLSSKLDGSSIKERHSKVELCASTELQLAGGRLQWGLHGGFHQGEFNYRSGEAELDIDGWGAGAQLGFSPETVPRLSLQLNVDFTQLEGRDYVDHTLGTTGLSRDAKLELFSTTLGLEFLLIQTRYRGLWHTLKTRAGWEHREWQMNTGWTTDPKESMELDDGGRIGFLYHIADNTSPSSRRAELYVGTAAGGHEISFALGTSF
jgi:hypothetical protein